jgi:hypothetical protein
MTKGLSGPLGDARDTVIGLAPRALKEQPSRIRKGILDMRPSKKVGCERFPCTDVKHACYIIPDVKGTDAHGRRRHQGRQLHCSEDG